MSETNYNTRGDALAAAEALIRRMDTGGWRVAVWRWTDWRFAITTGFITLTQYNLNGVPKTYCAFAHDNEIDYENSRLHYGIYADNPNDAVRKAARERVAEIKKSMIARKKLMAYTLDKESPK